MNWLEVETHWTDICKKALSNWNQLDEETVDATQGKPAALSKLIQETYGVSVEEADQQLETWLGNLLGNTQDPVIYDAALEIKLEENQDTPETIEKRDAVIGSPYHKGY
jgi:hypothetical protein